MARFRHSQIPNTLRMESSLYDLVGAQLAAMGHKIESVNGTSVGGVQVIQVEQPGTESAHYRGGSDFRKDGQAVGW